MRGLEEFPTIKQYVDGVGPIQLGGGAYKNQFDWYRCYKCRDLITREQEIAWQIWAVKQGEDDSEIVFCNCGSLKIVPARMPRRLEWIQRNVLRYTVKVILARGLAPWLDKYFRNALPLIEYLVSPKRVKGENNG